MTKTYKLFLTAVVAVAASISAMAETNKYVKVTSAPTDWSGDYLIVYEAGNVAFDGGLETLDAEGNTIDVTIDNGTIVATDATNAAKFTIAAVEGGYSIKSSSGKYIGQTSNANGLKSNATALKNTISLDGDGNVLFTSSSAVLRYNTASNQLRFRYYKSASYTAQKAIQLYKYTGAAIVTVAAPEITADAASFEESTTVNITAEDGAAIYYTIDGTTPTAESTAYTEPFDVTATTTVKAIAVKNGKSSSVASLALTKVDVTSMTFAEAYDWCIAKGTESKKHDGYVKITFENAKVLYADETAIYVRQGEKAMQFYGFPFSEKAVVANDVLNGTYAGQLQAYKGIPELSASDKITTAANVTVTNSEDVAAAISATVADVEDRTYICDLVELTKVTITKDGDYFWLNSGDNDVEVKVTNSLIPTEYTNKLYNVTAVVSGTWDNEGVLTLLSCEYVGEVPSEPGIVTAVEGVNANKLDANAPIYNLQGQRVDKNAKGILIQNGKKIVVK